MSQTNEKALNRAGLKYLWQLVLNKLPKKTSQLTNDSGFITSNDIPEGAAASTTTPKMDGTAAVGTEMAFARGDHRHPSDTTKVDKVTGKGLSTNDYTTAEKNKLDGIAEGANKYVHPTHTAKASGLYKVTVDAEGHVSAASAVEKGDITALGIPASNTEYDPATAAADGLMSAADKAKLNGIAENANNYTLPTAGSALGGVKTTSTVSSASGYTPVPIIGGVPYYKDTNTEYDAATSATDGLMSKADKAKLDGFGSASSYALKSDLTNVYHYKGSVATFADLPSISLTAGDVYNVEEDNMNYGWTEAGTWDPLGAIFKMEYLTNEEIDAALAEVEAG